MPVPVSDEPRDTRVERAQNGDVRAFEALYRENAPQIYALCLRSTARVDRAENLTQETFVRAWKSLGRFKQRSRFSSWLFSIALNLIRDEYRREKPTSALDDETEPPDFTRRHSCAAVDLERAIKSLPKKARIVFVLHDVYGHTHADVAESLGVTAGTSKAQLSRARALLRERLSQ